MQKQIWSSVLDPSSHPRRSAAQAKRIITAVQTVICGQWSGRRKDLTQCVDAHAVDTLKLCPLEPFPQHNIFIVPEPYQFRTFGVQVGGSIIVCQPT